MVEVVNPDQVSQLQEAIENNMADYIDEWVMDKVERLIEETLDDVAKHYDKLFYELEEELIYEMYKMKKEMEDQIQMQSKVTKRSFWKWWK